MDRSKSVLGKCDETKGKTGFAGRKRDHFLGRPLRKFAKDESGSFVILTLYLLIAMFIVTGLAVDAVRYEAKRARLQNTLDRAILAAADMSQTMTAQAVVDQYFEKAGLSDFEPVVTSSDGFNTRTVSATGSGSLDTFFMSWLGINSLDTQASGTAEESISDIEVSLVLDISGSMGQYITATGTYWTRYGSRTYTYNTADKKIDALKSAASEFVDTIYGSTTTARTSMSIVPYASQVNLGPKLGSKFNLSNQNTVNNCVDFTEAQFSSTAVSGSQALNRSDYFDYTTRSKPLSSPAVCSTSASTEVLALSDKPNKLKARINGLTEGGYTSVEIGMKWGAALLDPAAQSVITAMHNDPTIPADDKIPASFVGRPYAFNNSDTMKVAVVMTDGQNTTQYVLRDNYKGQASGVWKYVDAGNVYYSVAQAEGSNIDRDGDWIKNEPYWRLSQSGTEKWGLLPYGGVLATQLTYQQLFSEMSIDYHAYHLRRAIFGSNTDYYNWDDEPYTYIGESTKNTRLDAICDKAKENNIIIFAIGFEVNDYQAGILRNCASSPSHFYKVDGLEITTAFQSIANAIGKLRLTQ